MLIGGYETVKMAVERFIDSRVPVFIWGAPGVGKSAMVADISKRRGVELIDLRASLLDPVDIRGLPIVEDGKAVWCPMGELPDPEHDGEGILFLDELNVAPMAVQAALYQLVLNRRIGTYRLPDGWAVIAAGNRVEDRAAAHRLSSALANRMAHVELAVSIDDWRRWALTVGMPEEIIGLLSFRPELLHDWSPDRTVNATPRSWAFAARVLVKHPEMGKHELIETLSAVVGEGPATEFAAFLEMAQTLPSPSEVLANPDTAAVPDELSGKFAITMALVRRVENKTAEAAMTYIRRLPIEFQVTFVRSLCSRDPSFSTHPAIGRWVSDHGQEMMR